MSPFTTALYWVSGIAFGGAALFFGSLLARIVVGFLEKLSGEPGSRYLSFLSRALKVLEDMSLGMIIILAGAAAWLLVEAAYSLIRLIQAASRILSA